MSRKYLWVWLVLVLCLCGCDRSDKNTNSGVVPPNPPPKPPPAGDATLLLEWNRKTLLGDYEKAGSKNPKWDEDARAALEQFAQFRAARRADAGENVRQIGLAVTRSMASGCDDPMISYLQLCFVSWVATNSPRAYAEQFRKTADRLAQSSYSPVRKFYAGYGACEALRQAADNPRVQPAESMRMERIAYDQISIFAQDRTAPLEELYDAFHIIADEASRNPRSFDGFVKFASAMVFKRWPDEPLSLLLKAEYAIKHAWAARGNGAANTVTPEGWKLFKERLSLGREALEKAWQRCTNDERIPTTMLTICQGLPLERDIMEQWFERSMALNPRNYDACIRKLTYLEPKWHGSAEDVLAFGRQCVATEKWEGSVPLILTDAHEALSRYAPGEAWKQYWKHPEVWEDLRTAFERFFKLNPDEVGYRHNYALYAYRCEQWAALKTQLSLFGPTNHAYFGGPEEFNKMAKLAHELGADKTLKTAR